MFKKKRIAHWTDGDSGVYTDGTRFRLAGVRAPEKHQFGGQKATKVASGMTARSNGFVTVKSVGRSYNRTVDYQANKDGSINKRLMQRGYTNKGR
ncbi:MAG: thermonuclease family protein [Candidatus Izemoplasmatales bacterium]|nr:thermonuclease family protein [Candidatus Izemoplasmatales bacterium]